MKLRKVLKKLLKFFVLAICACLIIILINIFLNQYNFITKYQINNEKIPNSFDGYKIIQLTDIHSIRDIKQKTELIAKVKTENPDIIFITGDLIDAGYYTEENSKYILGEIDFPDKLTFEFVIELNDIANVYFIYGNHEMMLLDDPENNIFKTSLENEGVKILNNITDRITINDESIKIVGVQDPATLYKDKKYAYIGENNQDKVKAILDDLFINDNTSDNQINDNNSNNTLYNNGETNDNSNNDVLDDEFTILLSHRPEYFELYTQYPVDLALTGHTHGGVVRLPIIGGLYAHPQGWFPEYTSGLYSKNNFNMIIGRGIGYSQVPIRIFNPPEIVEIILNKN